MTQQGFILGTVPYMAPEQFEEGATADKKTDIFSYGDVYYELLTGKHPFAIPRELYPTIRRIQTSEPEPPSQSVPNCPEPLEWLILRALAKDREIRYPDFNELLLDNEVILIDLERERAGQLLAEVHPMIARGELDEAEAQVARVLELDPGNREARELRRTLRSRINEERFASRIVTLLGESEEQISKREFAEAVQTLKTALRLKPDDPEIERRLAYANERLSAYLDANQLVAEARRFQQKGQTSDAEERLKSALLLDPQHTDARVLVSRMEVEAERRRVEEMERAITESQTLLEQGRYAEALAALPDVESGPERERVAQLRLEIEGRQAEYERLLRSQRFLGGVAKVRETLQQNDLAKATEQLEYLEQHFAEEANAPELLRELRDQLEAQLQSAAIAGEVETARQLSDAGGLLDAIQVLDEALLRFGNVEALVEARREIAERHETQQRAELLVEALEDVNALRQSGKPREALNALEAHRSRIGADPALALVAEELKQQIDKEAYAAGLTSLSDHVRGQISEERFQEAIAAIEAAPEYSGEPEIGALLASARSSAARERERRATESAMKQARSAEQAGNRNTALRILEKALDSFPDSQAVRDAVDALRSRIESAARELRIAEYQRAIEQSLEARDWNKTRIHLGAARSEFASESIFAVLQDQLESAYQSAWKEFAGRVREQLAANRFNDVTAEMNRSAAQFAGDARLRELEAEIENRKAYEAALARAAALRVRGEFQQAEARLTDLLRASVPDDRASWMLAEVRYEGGLAEARALRKQQKLSEAEQRLNHLLRDHPADARVQELLAEVRDARLAQAEAAISRGDFDRGLALLRDMRATAPPEWRSMLDLAWERALEKERQADIDRLTGSIRQLIKQERIEDARSELARGRASYSREEIWLLLDLEISARQQFLRGLEDVHRECRAGNYEKADGILRTLRPSEPGDPARIEALAQTIAEGKKREARKQALLEARRRLAELKAAGDLPPILAYLEQVRHEFPEIAEFQREYAAVLRQSKAPEEGPPPILEEPVREPPVAPEPVIKRWWMGAAAALIIAIAGIVYWQRPRAPVPPAPSQFASVRIASEPPGASVTFNEQACTAPCTLRIPKGTHALRARLEGYQPGQRDVVIGDNELRGGQDVTIALQPVAPPPDIVEPPPSVAGSLEITVNPEDAVVLVDGKRYGMPAAGRSVKATLDAGTHRVHVEKPNYTSIDQVVQIAAGETKRLRIDLRPLPGRITLTISGALPDVQISIDGEVRGKTSSSGSVTIEQVSPGPRRVRMTKDSYEPREELVRVEPNQTVVLNRIDLRRTSPDRAQLARAQFKTVPRDPDRLEEFAKQFDGTPEAAEARKLADQLREQAHKNQIAKEQAAKEQAAKEKAAKEQAAKEQAAREEAERQKKLRDAKLEVDRRAIADVLSRLQKAYANRDLNAIRAIWITVPNKTLDGSKKVFQTYGSVTVKLEQIGDPVIKQDDTATISCRRVVTTGGRPEDPEVVSIELRRTTAGWVITKII
jgi:tetratricopeptide (TPR) repeat protein